MNAGSGSAVLKGELNTDINIDRVQDTAQRLILPNPQHSHVVIHCRLSHRATSCMDRVSETGKSGDYHVANLPQSRGLAIPRSSPIPGRRLQ